MFRNPVTFEKREMKLIAKQKICDDLLLWNLAFLMNV